MDTKQKKRPDAQRPHPQDARRAADKRRPEADPRGKQQNGQPRREGPPQQRKRPPERTRRPEEDARRKPAQEGELRRRPEAQRPPVPQPRPIQSTAEEVVYRPGEQKAPKKKLSPQAEKRSRMRRRSAARAEERKKQLSLHRKRPSVVYTQPMPFNLNRLLLQLTVVLAVVLAVALGLSVFFKIDKVVVYGNRAYSAWMIQEASGLTEGDNLLTFSRPRASGKIITGLPYVKNARIGIKLPDTVNIYIEEFDVAYAIESEDGTWWLMTSTGRIVEQIDAGRAGTYTRVDGVKLDTPGVGGQGKAWEPDIAPPAATDPSGETEETAPVIVTAADRLDTALAILSALEKNDIVGEVASINVTNLANIELWYGVRYQVRVGDSSRLDYKISCMSRAIAQLSDYQMGVLDVSFTTWPDQPAFTPFA